MATAKRLTDMVIDEVSFVDRAANQHSTVAFAKNDGTTLEDTMPVLEQDLPDLFDADGDAVDPDLLEHGDVVYASDGTELVFTTEEIDDGDDSQWDSSGDYVGDFDDDDEDVGKSAGAFMRGLKGGFGGFKPPSGEMASAASQRGVRAGQHALKHKKKYAAGAGGTAVLGAGGTGYAMSKSLGDQVLEELSKAASNDEREKIIAKALDEVEVAKAEAAQAMQELADERDARIEMEFIAKADDYNLPLAAEEFGPILKRLVERMEPEDVEVLDQIFKAAGDALFDEVGYVGGGDNVSILDRVNAAAEEMVGKSDGFTTAEAQVALLESNPELYDAYLAEQNGR